MAPRLIKWTKRLVLLLLVLALLAFLAFGIFLYWPWEGKVEDVMSLVPYDVEFVMRGSFDDFEELDWFEHNLIDDPIHPLVGAWSSGRGRELPKGTQSLPSLRTTLANIEDQINEQIPIDAEWAKFGLVKDILRGESVVAGKICRGAKPKDGPPTWQEIIVLTRVSWRAKFVSALKNGFVRDNLGPEMKAEELPGGVYKLTFPRVRVRSLRERSACGGGEVMPEDNIWYLFRVDDVIALSNSESLISQTSDLASGSTLTKESFLDRRGYIVERDERGIRLAIVMDALHNYLVRATETVPDLKPMLHVLRPKALLKLAGGVNLDSTSLLHAEADIVISKPECRSTYDNIYRLSPRPVREGIADMVPAEDTFGVAFLRTNPEFLFNTIYQELHPADRRLWEDNLRRMGGYRRIEDFFRDLAGYMGETATVAVARLSEVFDKSDYAEWYSDDLDPYPAVAILVDVSPGTTLEDTTEFLRTKLPLIGIGTDLKEETYKGFTFAWGELEVKIMDFKLLEPCFIAVQGQLIIANNRQYLRKILDTIKGDAPSLSKDDRFRTTMAALPARGQLGVYFDLEKLTRIPQDGSPGAQPRGFLWDKRNQWVRTNKDPRAQAIAFREKEKRKLPRTLTPAQEDKLEESVDAYVRSWEAQYNDFISEYRTSLGKLRRLGAFGLVISVQETDLHLETAVQFREAEEWLEWKR